MKVLLIAGHGGNDPGACAFGYKESEEARKVVDRIQTKLTNLCEVLVYPKSHNAYHDAMSNMLTESLFKFDCVVEVHFNAHVLSPADGKTKGVEVYIANDSLERKEFAYKICKSVAGLGFTSRCVKVYPWKVIGEFYRKNVPHEVLVECCFIDDADDMKLYKPEKMGDAIASAVIDFFRLKEDKKVTQADFNKMMDTWLEGRAKVPADSWSEKERLFAEKIGAFRGGIDGNMRYKSFITREEAAAIIYRIMGEG